MNNAFRLQRGELPLDRYRPRSPSRIAAAGALLLAGLRLFEQWVELRHGGIDREQHLDGEPDGIDDQRNDRRQHDDRRTRGELRDR